jgi:hypothetical protein
MRLKVEEAGLTPLNGCRRCGEDFTSLETFDAHHVAEDEIHRCLDSKEISANGWTTDRKGRWFNPVRSARARAAFSKASESLEEARREPAVPTLDPR